MWSIQVVVRGCEIIGLSSRLHDRVAKGVTSWTMVDMQEVDDKQRSSKQEASGGSDAIIGHFQ